MDTAEKDIYLSVVMAAIILGVIITYFIYTLIRHQRRVLLLHKAKISAEINTLENERSRISADLHDELGPFLSAVKLQINSVEVVGEEDRRIVEKAGGHIDEIIQKIRDISYNLLPNTLIRKGLKPAVAEFVERIGQLHQLQIQFNCPAGFTLSQEKQINIYRIVQECVNNVLKHAHARRMVIDISQRPDKLLLTIYDDGVGFVYDEVARKNKGLGLRNLESRSEVLGAHLHFQSDPGKGTQYVFEIPV